MSMYRGKFFWCGDVAPVGIRYCPPPEDTSETIAALRDGMSKMYACGKHDVLAKATMKAFEDTCVNFGYDKNLLERHMDSRFGFRECEDGVEVVPVPGASMKQMLMGTLGDYIRAHQTRVLNEAPIEDLARLQWVTAYEGAYPEAVVYRSVKETLDRRISSMDNDERARFESACKTIGHEGRMGAIQRPGEIVASGLVADKASSIPDKTALRLAIAEPGTDVKSGPLGARQMCFDLGIEPFSTGKDRGAER